MDSNKIIIDGVNFDRTLPKWASEDTLARIKRSIDIANKDQKKSLGAIYDILKSVSKGTKDGNTEIKNLKTDYKAGTNKVLKGLKEIVAELKKSNTPAKKNNNSSKPDQEKKAIDANTVQSKKNTDNIINAINNTKNTTKLNELTRYSRSIFNTAQKMNNELVNIRANLNKQSNNSGSSNNQDISNVLGQISSTLLYISGNNITSSRALINAINGINRSGPPGPPPPRPPGGGPPGPPPPGPPGPPPGLSRLESIVHSFGRGVGLFSNVMRNTPFGKWILLLSSAASAAQKGAEYTYDAQKEFMGLLNRGLNFREVVQSTDYGSDRLDGIAIRNIITGAGVTLENAARLLENNTRTVNQVGFMSFFGDIGNVLGDARSSNSLPNKLGLTRDAIASMVSDYYTLSRQSNDLAKINDPLTRQTLAINFVRNIRTMSNILGTSTDEIREKIREFRNSSDFRAASVTFDTNQNDNVSVFNAMAGSLELPDIIRSAISSATTTANPQLAATSFINSIGDNSSILLSAIGPQLLSELGNVRNMNQPQQVDLMQRLLSSVDNFAKTNQTLIGSYRDSMGPEGADILSRLLNAREILATQTGNNAAPMFEDTSPINRLRLALENQGQMIDARSENLFASAANTEGGRQAIMNILSLDEISKNAQLSILDKMDDIIGSVMNGPVPTFLKMIHHLLSRYLPGASGSREALSGSAGQSFINSILPKLADAENSIIRRTVGANGNVTYGIDQNATKSDIEEYISAAYKNAKSDEERDAVLSLPKILSDGVIGWNKENSIDKHTREIVGSIRNGIYTRLGNDDPLNEEKIMDASMNFSSTDNLLGIRNGLWSYTNDNLSAVLGRDDVSNVGSRLNNNARLATPQTAPSTTSSQIDNQINAATANMSPNVPGNQNNPSNFGSLNSTNNMGGMITNETNNPGNTPGVNQSNESKKLIETLTENNALLRQLYNSQTDANRSMNSILNTIN